MRFLPALLATIATTAAAPSGPADAALAFLERVRDRQVDLEPGADTAIARETSRAKRREISRRLERMASDLGNSKLELGPVKTDGDLAAVLVRRSPDFDPTSLHVFPVAMLRSGERWLPAPMPASFENSGLQARPETRARIKALESWMLKTRALDLLKLRDEAAAKIRSKIESGLPLAKLRAMDSKQVAGSFLEACERRDLAVVIGLLGGLSERPPSNLRDRIRVCEEMLAKPFPDIRPWRLLCSDEVLRSVVHHEEDRKSALVSVGCLDPRAVRNQPGAPQVEIVHIELTRGRDTMWRVDPGAAFWIPSEEPDDEEEDGAILDGDLLDLFPARLREKHPAKPAETAEAAETATLAAIRAPRLVPLLETARIDANPGIARIALGRLAKLWFSRHGASPAHQLIPLARNEDGDSSVLFLQMLSPLDPEDFKPVTLFFQRGDEGWLWVPDSVTGRETFGEWLDEQEDHWPGAWRDKLLAGTYHIDKLPELPVPTTEQAADLVAAWFRDLHEGDLQTALGRCARFLENDGKDEVLRRAAVDLDDVRRSDGEPVVSRAEAGRVLTLVQTMIPRDESPTRPVYAVIATPVGPRILLDVDLFGDDSRTRQFLNRAAIDRLRLKHPDAAADVEEGMRKLAEAKNGATD